jgi:hypothetical protein
MRLAIEFVLYSALCFYWGWRVGRWNGMWLACSLIGLIVFAMSIVLRAIKVTCG